MIIGSDWRDIGITHLLKPFFYITFFVVSCGGPTWRHVLAKEAAILIIATLCMRLQVTGSIPARLQLIIGLLIP